LTGIQVIEKLGSGAGNPILAEIYSLRDQALSMVKRLYPVCKSALPAGILLGVESGIPASLQEAYQVTGTAHIIAICGFNIAILARLFGPFLNHWLEMRDRDTAPQRHGAAGDFLAPVICSVIYLLGL
jgi:hypothetical protein